jgi:uncharacterized membrane protein
MCWAQLGVTAAVMLLADAAWLSYIAPEFRAMIAGIQGSPMVAKLIPAAICYVVMILGLWYLVIRPAGRDITAAATQGAALGATVYGVYEMTNLAIIKSWSPRLALMDWIWGTVLFAGTAAAATYVAGA